MTHKEKVLNATGNKESPNHQTEDLKPTSRISGRKQRVDDLSIMKSFLKGIGCFAFSEKGLLNLRPLLEREDCELEEFYGFLGYIRNIMNQTDNLCSILIPKTFDSEQTCIFKRIFRDVGKVFIKYFSIDWILHAKIFKKKAHYKFRLKMLRRLQTPERYLT